MNSNSKQSLVFLVLGVAGIVAAVVFNEWTIAAWLSYGGSLRLFDRVAIWLFDFMFVGVGVVLIRKRHTIRMGKGKFLLLCGTLSILLLGSEVAARILDAAHGNDFLQNKQRAQRSIIPFRMFGPDFYATENGLRYIVGRHGEKFPFEKPEGTFRIVTMGGSTTQNLVDGMHYPLRLQEMLVELYPNRTIEVINTGNSAYATPHLIIALAMDVLSWKPDLIIASENINDLIAAYFPDFALDYSNKYFHETFLPHPSLIQQLFGWSRLYWVIVSRTEALSYRMLEARNTVYMRRSYGNEPPPEAKAVFRRNWETFVDVARGRDIPVILASQPLESEEHYWDLHMRYKKYNDVAVYPLHEEFLLHHAMYNATIKEVANEKGVFFVDNAAVFAGEPSLFSDFVHYTRAGIETLAKNYTAFIARHNLIK